MSTLIAAALIVLGYLWLGWFGVVLSLFVWITLVIVWAVLSALYTGMHEVVRYHGGWRGVWRYVRS